MDADYFKEPVLHLLKSRGADYAIKVPFWPWLNMQALVRARKQWTRIGDEVDSFETSLFLEPWQMDIQVRIFRKRVFHQTRKNFQLATCAETRPRNERQTGLYRMKRIQTSPRDPQPSWSHRQTPRSDRLSTDGELHRRGLYRKIVDRLATAA